MAPPFYINKQPIWYTRHAHTHATVHCMTTTPKALVRECSSFLIVAIAATHGVYSRVKIRKLTAARGVKSPVSTLPSSAVPAPVSTLRVLTTASFAVKPLISAVLTRQSEKPRGTKMGAIHRPIMASRLSPWSVTTLNW